MRLPKAPAVLAAFVLLVWNVNLLRAVAPEQSISGRLIFENASFSCERCLVSLLASGIRPIGTVYADLGGHFVFNNVPRGSYTVRVDIDGFESVSQQVDPLDATSVVNVLVSLKRNPTNPTTGAGVVNIAEFLDRYPKKAVSYFEKGNNSLKKNKNSEAIKDLQNAVELAPTFYEAHNQLGIAYQGAGRFDDAEREFVKAHELNSNGVEPLVNLTKLYLDQNEPDRAVSASEQAVKANSSSPSAFFSLGMALYKAAQLDRAETALKRALDLAPKMATVRLMLANVYMKLRRYDRTLEQLNSYIAENPRGADLLAAEQMRDQLLNAGVTDQP